MTGKVELSLHGSVLAAPSPKVTDDAFVAFDTSHSDGLYQPSRTRVDRISVALWRYGRGDPSPLFAPRASGWMHTGVVVWPVDAAGHLTDNQLAGAAVREWRLSPVDFACLQKLHEDFHTGRHDLWIQAGDPLSIQPCPRSLLAVVEEYKPELALKLSADVDDLREKLAGGGGPGRAPA